MFCLYYAVLYCFENIAVVVVVGSNNRNYSPRAKMTHRRTGWASCSSQLERMLKPRHTSTILVFSYFALFDIGVIHICFIDSLLLFFSS